MKGHECCGVVKVAWRFSWRYVLRVVGNGNKIVLLESDIARTGTKLMPLAKSVAQWQAGVPTPLTHQTAENSAGRSCVVVAGRSRRQGRQRDWTPSLLSGGVCQRRKIAGPALSGRPSSGERQWPTIRGHLFLTNGVGEAGDRCAPCPPRRGFFGARRAYPARLLGRAWPAGSGRSPGSRPYCAGPSTPSLVRPRRYRKT